MDLPSVSNIAHTASIMGGVAAGNASMNLASKATSVQRGQPSVPNIVNAASTMGGVAAGTASTGLTHAVHAVDGVVTNSTNRNLPATSSRPSVPRIGRSVSAGGSIGVGVDVAVNSPGAIPAAAAIFVSPRDSVASINTSPQGSPTFYDGIAVLDDYCKPKEVGKPVSEYWANLTATAF